MIDEYILLQRQIRKINTKLMTLEHKQTTPRVPILSDMPKGPTKDFDSMTTYVIKCEELRDERTELVAQCDELTKHLTDREKSVLYYRYVEEFKFIEIAHKLNISIRQIFRIHKNILKKMQKDYVHVTKNIV